MNYKQQVTAMAFTVLLVSSCHGMHKLNRTAKKYFYNIFGYEQKPHNLNKSQEDLLKGFTIKTATKKEDSSAKKSTKNFLNKQ